MFETDFYFLEPSLEHHIYWVGLNVRLRSCPEEMGDISRYLIDLSTDELTLSKIDRSPEEGPVLAWAEYSLSQVYASIHGRMMTSPRFLKIPTLSLIDSAGTLGALTVSRSPFPAPGRKTRRIISTS